MPHIHEEDHASSISASIDPHSTKKSFFNKNTILLFIISLLLCVGVIVSHQGYQKYRIIIKQNRAINQTTNQLVANVLSLQQEQQSLQKVLDKLHHNSNMSYYVSLLTTTNQLAAAANLVLKTENDVDKALSLLATAQQYIAKVHEFSSIQESLGKDIAKLKAAILPDPEKTITQLNRIIKQINSLEQALAITNTDTSLEQTPLAAKTNATSSNVETKTTWKRIVHNMSQGLHNVVTITNKENLPLALTSSQLINFKLNLQALLLEASWAVTHHNDKIYKMALQETFDLLETYFSANEGVKNKILPAIQELQQLDLNLQPLNIDDSLKIIQTTVEQQTVTNVSGLPT